MAAQPDTVTTIGLALIAALSVLVLILLILADREREQATARPTDTAEPVYRGRHYKPWWKQAALDVVDVLADGWQQRVVGGAL